jgi:hypothetical protein
MRKRCSWINDHKPWTAAEEDYLRANRGAMTAAAMAAALPGRTRDAVQSRCQQLGLWKRDLRPEKPAGRMNKKFWLRSEVVVLRMHHLSGPAWIQKWHLPHRSQDSIGTAIKRLVRVPMSHPATAVPADLQVAA